METIVMDTCSIFNILDSRQPALCPYHDAATNTCAASISSIKVDGVRNRGYCSCDNYDNCALFLAKTLRLK